MPGPLTHRQRDTVVPLRGQSAPEARRFPSSVCTGNIIQMRGVNIIRYGLAQQHIHVVRKIKVGRGNFTRPPSLCSFLLLKNELYFYQLEQAKFPGSGQQGTTDGQKSRVHRSFP